LIDLNISKNEELNLWEVDATLTLPPLTIKRYKAEKRDIKYEVQRAFEDIVRDICEKHIEDEDY
tara:strand:- start:301 stop:492 length:192 start_codon:yes stop_codon:yes gene_type:complete